ncbi:MAG TPA: hypothetical protein DDY49_04155 [Paenibacillaceae bacterium]|nr:hypothetical protein [Paenibacillaceae bacterium]
MNSGTDIFYKQVKINELEGVVKTHQAAFKDYFLTNLGDKFLFRFYKEFLEDKDTIAIGAYVQEKLVGFILCSKNKNHVMDKFYQKNFWFIIRNVIIQTLKMNKIIISGLISRFKLGIGVIKSLLFPNNIQPDANNTEISTAHNTRLLSIAVLPQYQGTGASKGMMSFFHNYLMEDNVNAVGLSVKKENTRAIKFYEKMGWQVEKKERNAIYFVKTF